jgi:hypothetical protein
MKKRLLMFLVVLSPFLLSAQDYYHELFPVDTIAFEHNTIPYQIDPSAGNCWQVGRPSKIFFDSAFSAPLAIVTDTLNPYPVNCTGSFSFAMPYDLVNGTFTTFFQYIHKYDTDTLQDYGSVEVSYDHGLNWQALRDSTCPQFYECISLYWDYDYILPTWEKLPHNLYPSGHSNGWILSRYIWWWTMPVKNNPDVYPFDTIKVRFTFHSDDIASSKEGWMIDDIIIGFRDEGSGISEADPEPSLRIFPNPLSEKSSVSWITRTRTFDFFVYDLTGRIVFEGTSKPGTPVILRKEKFKNGIYFWKASSLRMKDQAGKLIVQ